MINTGKPLRLFLALFAAVLLLASCANVPEESQPEVVKSDLPGQTADVPDPAKDLDALSVVRNFVHASAQSINDNAGARAYLDQNARTNWRPTKRASILGDMFNTVYATPDQQSTSDEQLVVLRGATVGTLAPDSSFISVKNSYELPIHLRKQADGQWRIIDPPPELVMTETDFTANYFRVPVYFFAPNSTAPVPDLRYVPGKPQAGLAARVVDLLLDGPSDGLSGAVRNPLGDRAGLESNVKSEADGALLVPLTGVGDQSPDDKRLILAQIVLSLQTVTTSRIRLLSDGAPLIEGHGDWLPSDLPAYAAQVSPSSELPGLMSADGRVRSLLDGTPIPGPAGSGAYQVANAAQSLDGKQLAIVEDADGRQRLRVGDFGREAQIVDLAGGSLTRPTWWSPTGGIGEVWTVVDGAQVVRVQRSPGSKWARQSVNADEVAAIGPITALRLSRDGARAAIVAGGRLVVTSVVRTPDSVMLRMPRIISGSGLAEVRDVDWLSQDTLVVATAASSLLVAKMPIDGLRIDPFNSSNLTPPVRAITASPSRSVMVADAGGLWTASDVGEVWRPYPHSPDAPDPNVIPFYPG
jgi:hypothetical protein